MSSLIERRESALKKIPDIASSSPYLLTDEDKHALLGNLLANRRVENGLSRFGFALDSSIWIEMEEFVRGYRLAHKISPLKTPQHTPHLIEVFETLFTDKKKVTDANWDDELVSEVIEKLGSLDTFERSMELLGVVPRRTY